MLTAAPLQTAWAQKAVELQLHGLTTLADEQFFGGGLGLALRTNGRMRVGTIVSAGNYDGAASVRPELLASFHLNPFKRSGVSPYVGGGVALVLTSNESLEYLVGVIGLEWKPGSSRGWFVEVGVAGGVRVATGIQLRRRGRPR
jgi:outer membrane protein W